MTSTAASSLMPSVEKDEIEIASETFLTVKDPARRRAIVAEAQRLRARLSSIPWYADKEKRHGPKAWLQLASSYGGEE